MDCETERNKVIDEIERLMQETNKLKEDIDRIEAKDEKLRARTIIGKGFKKLYWKLPVKWLETVFYTRKNELKELCSACMSFDCRQYLSRDYNFCAADYTTHVAQMAGVCEGFKETENGIRLVLRDPYAEFKTSPLDITRENAEKLVGRLIIIDCSLKNITVRDVDVVRYRATAYTLHGIHDETDKITDPVAKLAFELADISEEEEAVKGVTAIQNYVRAEMKESKVLRISPTEVRILYKDENKHVHLYGISFENGEFWFMQDADEHNIDGDAWIDLVKHICGGESTDNSNSDLVNQFNKSRWEFLCISEVLPDAGDEVYR